MQDTQPVSGSISDRDLSDAVTTLAPLEQAAADSAAVLFAANGKGKGNSSYDKNSVSVQSVPSAPANPNPYDFNDPSDNIAEYLNWDLGTVEANVGALAKAAEAIENAVNDIAAARKHLTSWKGDAAKAASKDFDKVSTECQDQRSQVKSMDDAMIGQSGSVAATLHTMAAGIHSEAAGLVAANQQNIDTVTAAQDTSNNVDPTAYQAAGKAVADAVHEMNQYLQGQVDGLSATQKMIEGYQRRLAKSP